MTEHGSLHNARYGWGHRRLRARWAQVVDAGAAVCERCGKAIAPGAPWDLGHDDLNPLGQARGPEHRACNRATLSHHKAASTALANDPDPGNTVTRWSRHWHGPFNPRCPRCRELGVACDDSAVAA